ncbi:MAG: prepilin-type N-terminal cleavage/methylation domain-containing protein [Deltaproteobacteria bacterium]|nr:prepilin-type N-terminal cleavage/methylation domain-containing protein [Deltaproteobacteria bacterium]MBW2086865.1 prepilin-type N-terminal cleavage/methylation domain-containing protein [Deltaproteobacteria bacterium]
MKPRCKGFTLLEIMIALAFIAVALVTVIQAQGQGVKLTEQVRFTSRTVFLARQVMAEAQARADLTEGVERGTFDEPLNDLAWERSVVPLPILQGLYKIVIRIHHTGSPAHEGLVLEGIVYKEPR